MYILGDKTNDFKNGCSSRDWVTTGDQESFPLPQGFTRPTSITFPVFTFGPTPQLIVDCEVFLCTEAGYALLSYLSFSDTTISPSRSEYLQIEQNA